MTLDKDTRLAIAEAVKKATIEVQEMYEEKWLTAEQLCEEIPIFNKDWLARNGKKLPRERVCWMDENGTNHNLKFCYPQKRISRMLAEGKLRQL